MLKNDEITKLMQKKELEMLKYIDNLFTKNNIKYFLACGTALGCARHSGFIPWDDDVDIYIFGKDYKKAREVFLSQSDNIFVWQDGETVNNYPYSFPKIVNTSTVLIEKGLSQLPYSCGIYIDIFPLIEENKNLLKLFFSEKLRYFRYAILRSYYYNYSSKIKKLSSYFIRLFVNPKKIQKQLIHTYSQRKNKSKYLIDSGVFGKHALLLDENFKGEILLKFEDSVFPMPMGYKEYLKHYYGDYLKLPEESDRISNHNISKLVIEGIEYKL